ncbi:MULTISPECIES: zinc ABC transporter substrate-binding protein ZnuA [Vibrio]|jgi:zinc transport system substrate-binding protein|uniref:High-affinity zinc uptake system protein ZnuA n=1 Tax=Vibrio harveyi TaxID=669 RepID=A0A454CVE6_VIBHA|nr:MULTISPECIES: zinc ABC transporter substrate-binding protein ZnuA [Vibrio]AWA98143.1 zinc ABC transporter substrate-binding protein ZnuA [Vibrio harveyi]EKM30350.1 high-affinity zinc uptake system protein znuA [Vibrio harveyi]EKO3785402.1 zinc ABC transporter substrate-binding protein ZnuA [Vibrio harveyi]EKO3841862.1 zinc ABC transporter substrate-binding protein ZnuA [Vibrio harveyi]EKO3867851.1 zinc ABC transporter substrate-binding protein ZnuA [Vibrio harveyi]
MKRAIILAVSAILTLPAHAVTVLTSIKPIQMITTELTEGVTAPDVLLQNNASPHDYALRPSDVQKVAAADLVIWYGHDLEPFLEKVVTDRGNTLTLSQIPGLSLREFGSEHSHDHDGHDHGTHDPHFWLGVETVQQVANAIAHKLAEVDPVHADTYANNLKKFEVKLNATDSEIKQQLAPVKDKGYFVFHDAYGYFEERYGLNQMGHFTVSPDRKPGAKTLIRIRKTLGTGDVACVFSEPQFTPAVIESVMRGSNVRSGVLDPLGSEVEVKSGSYFEFLKGMSNSFSQCLSEK